MMTENLQDFAIALADLMEEYDVEFEINDDEAGRWLEIRQSDMRSDFAVRGSLIDSDDVWDALKGGE